MEKGTQVAYIPRHANGDINHPDVDFGFVMSESGDAHFCRFWLKGHIGNVLRTTANSELTPNECLVPHTSVDQDAVDDVIQIIEYRWKRRNKHWNSVPARTRD